MTMAQHPQRNAIPKVDALTDIPDQYISSQTAAAITRMVNSAWVMNQVSVLLWHTSDAPSRAILAAVLDAQAAQGIPAITFAQYYALATT